MPLPPRAVTSSAVSSIVPCRLSVVASPLTLRPVTYTVAPASPSASAMPRPAPRLAPVTTAILPCNDPAGGRADEFMGAKILSASDEGRQQRAFTAGSNFKAPADLPKTLLHSEYSESAIPRATQHCRNGCGGHALAKIFDLQDH